MFFNLLALLVSQKQILILHIFIPLQQLHLNPTILQNIMRIAIRKRLIRTAPSTKLLLVQSNSAADVAHFLEDAVLINGGKFPVFVEDFTLYHG